MKVEKCTKTCVPRNNISNVFELKNILLLMQFVLVNGLCPVKCYKVWGQNLLYVQATCSYGALMRRIRGKSKTFCAREDKQRRANERVRKRDKEKKKERRKEREKKSVRKYTGLEGKKKPALHWLVPISRLYHP